jgi:hypothetical protein
MLAQREAVNRDRAWEPAAAYGGAMSATQQAAKTVAPVGGDYATPNAAVSALSDASAWKRYRVTVEPGTYNAGEFFDRDYVDLVGRNPEECRIRLFQPDNSSATVIAENSAMYMLRNTRLIGLTFEVKNARYGIHLESGNGAPDRLQEIIGCVLLHFGNDDAALSTWVAQYAVGSGLSSGQTVRVRDSYIWGKNAGAFYYHTNVDYAHPSFVDSEGSSLIAETEGGAALVAVSCGSRQSDQCRVVGNVLGGDVRYITEPWLQSTLDKLPANRAEIQMYGSGNSPAVFRITDAAQALRIDSATTGASSSVVVSGTAAPFIFGDGATNRTFSRKGSPGFAGAVWGWGDVSGQAVGKFQNVLISSIGKRLGNCTGATKALSVVVDGGAPITVSFNADHTNQSNATIMGIINAALGAAATASTWKPGSRYRPRFSDEEQSLLNDTGTGIAMGSVLALDILRGDEPETGSRQKVRLMTNADSPDLFAGIAWEDIQAGKRGRVKTRGWLPITDVLRSDSGALEGGTMSVGATPGRVQIGGTQGLLAAVRSDAVEVRP